MADEVLDRISYFEESKGVYRNKEPEDTFVGTKKTTFYFAIDEVQNKDNPAILFIIPQDNFFYSMEFYDPCLKGYFRAGNSAPAHDVAVTEVALAYVTVYEGGQLSFNVTVEN